MPFLSRRTLLKAGLGAGVAAEIGPRLPMGHDRRVAARLPRRQAAATPVGEAGAPLDVAIIGAGVSGVYAGWRLLGPEGEQSDVLEALRRRRGGPASVVVFERGDRIGGRLFSVTPPGMPHLRAELGGMRFLSNQQIVASLVDHLGMATAPFPVDAPENLAYLRGRRFPLARFADPAIVPYDLPPAFRGKTPSEVLLAAIQQFGPNAAVLDHRGWDAIKPTATANGRPLHDSGFWNLLLDTIGQEGRSFLRDALGYAGIVSNFNAIEAMEMMVADFVGSPPPQYLQLRDGFQAMPEELARRFVAAGGTIQLGHQLRRIDRVVEDGEALLTLDLTVWPEGRPLTIRARHVVLAMPQRSIELLAPDSFPFTSNQFLSDLGAVIPRPASKLFLGYDRPWWEDLGLHNGRSLTDLPLRQVYYWGVEGDQPGADPANRNALLMASYNDADDVEFWNELLPRPNRLDPVAVTRPPRPMGTATPEVMIEEAQHQLRDLHGPGARIPDPTVAYFQDWVQDPYGAAYHFWQVGARSWEIVPRMRHPFPDTNLAVCGEAWSTGQGWVHGALNTAEMMLAEHFRLPRPAWLPDDAYLGP